MLTVSSNDVKMPKKKKLRSSRKKPQKKNAQLKKSQDQLKSKVQMLLRNVKKLGTI